MTGQLSLAQVNALSRQEFVEKFGGIAEDSPWVSQRAWERRPFGTHAAMVAAFQAVLLCATRQEQHDVICAHPDLAGRAALAVDSQAEQAAAGLDTLSADEFTRFNSLNTRYRARFGFPFILAVRGAGKQQILEAFASRLDGGIDEEFVTALAQIMRIMRFRLEDRVDAGSRTG